MSELVIAPSQLRKMEDEHNIFGVTCQLGNDSAYFYECCDRYYGAILTIDQIRELGNDLLKLADDLEKNVGLSSVANP